MLKFIANLLPKRATRKNCRVRLRFEELESRLLPNSTLPSAGIDQSPYATDHIIVRWLAGAPDSALLSTGTQSLGNNTYDVRLAAGVSVTQAIDYYSHLSGVDFAQPDFILRTASVPNDTYYGYQWALNAISAPAAWNFTTGGNRIVVATIDTGVDYRDADLAPNIIAGYNFVNNTANPLDDNGHGTNVAGIIGAVGNNGQGIAGVDWNVEIMPLKFMAANGQGYLSDAVLAMNYAVDHGARIINNSWAGGGYDPAMASAIQNALNHGDIVVAAAGNGGANLDAAPSYPASYHYANLISVAATDANNNLASFSNYGPDTVQIAAPGVSILSTALNNGYAYYTGTSQAAPFVSGALALVWSIHPEWSYREVIADVLNNVDKVAGLTGKVGTGGLLDIGKAIAAALPTPTPIPTPAPTPSVTFLSATANAAISDRQTVTSTITINQHITIGNLSVIVSAYDSHDADLVLELVSPTGKIYVLSNQRGNGSNFLCTTFDSYAATSIADGVAPFSGTFRPETSLADLQNTDAFGTWTITIASGAEGNAGTFVNWAIAVGAATTPTPTPTPSPITTSSVTFLSATANAAIRDYQTLTSTITINQHITVGNLSVIVSAYESNDANLVMELVSPTGKTYVLSNRRGNGANFLCTTFDSNAATSIGNGAAPFSGAFRPETTLAGLQNTDAFGTWTIKISCRAAGNTGTFVNWAIKVVPSNATKAASIDAAAGSAPTASTEFQAPAWISTSSASLGVANNGNSDSGKTSKPPCIDSTTANAPMPKDSSPSLRLSHVVSETKDGDRLSELLDE